MKTNGVRKRGWKGNRGRGKGNRGEIKRGEKKKDEKRENRHRDRKKDGMRPTDKRGRGEDRIIRDMLK